MYDLAIIVPCYTKIKQDGLEKAIEFYKKNIEVWKTNFKNSKLQIIFSNNTNYDLSSLAIDNVKIINNGKNLYAFNARKRGFEASDSKYVWFLDDDNEFYLNNEIEKEIKQDFDMLQLNSPITRQNLTPLIISSTLMKKIYNIIGLTTIRTYGEDTIVRELCFKYGNNIKTCNIQNFWDGLSVEWHVLETKKSYIRINDLIETYKEYNRLGIEFVPNLYLKNFLFTKNDFKQLIENKILTGISDVIKYIDYYLL